MAHGRLSEAHKNYVLVNIPSYHLRAVDGDHELQMRIGCGSLETKTPLLASRISA
jgi:murein L,D-transpeptidase YcbB/YkuD